MLHVAEANRLLAELPRDDPLKATEEVTAWLESLACATRFGIGQRLRVISMVDEAGQPAAEALMADYLAGENVQRADRFRQWQVLMNFWEKVADAYMEIVGYFEISRPGESKDQLPLATVRAMHAHVMQMRLALMRYASEPDLYVDRLVPALRVRSESALRDLSGGSLLVGTPNEHGEERAYQRGHAGSRGAPDTATAAD